MARRETKGEQYLAIAAFYGSALAENLHDSKIPEFVLVHEARRAAHYALTALRIDEKRRRKSAATHASAPARLVIDPCRAALSVPGGGTLTSHSIPS